MEEFNNKIFEAALNGEKIDVIAYTYDISKSKVLKLLNTLEDKNNPNYNPNLAYNILINRNLKNNFIDKDELDDIVKMIFDGYMLIEISFIKGLSIENINKLLNIYKNISSPYYNPEFYEKINKALDKTMKMDDFILFKRLAKLEKQGVNLNDYPKINIIKRYDSLKKYYLMIEDFLNDNYTSFKQLFTKYHLNHNTLAQIVREEDNFKFLTNCVDPITKQKIKLKYLQRKNELEHCGIEFRNNNEDKEKFYYVYKNIDFWILFMITFKLSIYDFAKFLEIKDVKKLYNTVFNRVIELDSKFINAFGFINEKESSENILQAKKFYQKYLLMKRIDKDKASKMLDLLKDKEYLSLVKSKKKLKDMTREERLIICNYWEKYAIPIQKLPYSIKDLNEYCRPLMLEKIKKIEEYNQETLKIYQKKYLKK